MPSPFRISSRAFFITYPQCTLSPKRIAEFSATKGALTYSLVVRELHEDGHPHLHALLIFADKLTIRSQAAFDVEGFHPNLQAARDRTHIKNYCLKGEPSGEDLHETGTFDAGHRGSATRAAWEAAVNAKTADEVMAAVALASPRDFLLCHDRVKAYAETKKLSNQPYVPPPDQLFPRILPSMQEYLRLEFPKKVRDMWRAHALRASR